MTKYYVDEDYYVWLVNLLTTKYERSNNPQIMNVLSVMHETPFYVKHSPGSGLEMDRNRETDGRTLRVEYANECNLTRNQLLKLDSDSKPCSFLEMIAALCLKAGEHIFGYPFVSDGTRWMFHEIVLNLGLMHTTRYETKQKLINVMERNYGSDGMGGMFYIPDCSIDMRETELWIQMMVYVNLKYDGVDFLKEKI